MRHKVKKLHLGRKRSHRRDLMRQLATSLFLHEKIETTLAKAKAVRPYAEKLVTLAKKDTIDARRRAAVKLAHNNAVKKLFKEIGPKYKKISGGYTRIHRTRSRSGDSAEKANISLV